MLVTRWIEKVARKRATALESKIPKLLVNPPNGAPIDVNITDNGAPLDKTLWRVPVPVDPGKHILVVVYPKGEQATRTIDVPSDGSTVNIELPAPAAPIASTPQPATQPTHPQRETVKVSRDAIPPTRIAGFVAIGVGVVGLGIGTGFGLHSKARRDESAGECEGNLCTEAGTSLREDAHRAGNISTIAFVGGGIAAVTGAILVLTSKSTGPEKRADNRFRVAPNIALGGGGLSLSRSF